MNLRRKEEKTFLPKALHDGVANGIKHGVRGSEVTEQHDEEAMVSQLVELCATGFKVLDQYLNNHVKHLNTAQKEQRCHSSHMNNTFELSSDLCSSRCSKDYSINN